MFVCNILKEVTVYLISLATTGFLVSASFPSRTSVYLTEYEEYNCSRKSHTTTSHFTNNAATKRSHQSNNVLYQSKGTCFGQQIFVEVFL